MAEHTVEWEFDHPPSAVWPLLADTARFNEAAGLPKHAVRREEQPDGSVRFFAEARIGLVDLAWEEIPVEWVSERWFRHERRFSRGPLARLTAVAELRPSATGTVCRYTMAAEPAGPFGRLLLAAGFLRRAERSLATLVDRVREHLAGRRPVAYAPPRPPLDAARRRRLERLVETVEASGNGHGLADRLAALIADGQDLDVEKIRPRALARRWGVPEREAVELCLQAVRDGLLESRWDVLCPRCRGAQLAATALDRLPTRAHCDSCNIGYDRDFARNVELSFRPAPGIRPLADGEFCLFGPMSTPHVAAQLRLEAGERRSVPAGLAPGPWRYRTLEPGGQADVTVDDAGMPAVIVGSEGVGAGPPSPGGTLNLENRDDRPRLVVVESRRWVEDALTAHRVTTLQAFRDLFAGEVLRPGDEVAIAQIALLFTDLSGSTALYERIGDAAAYHLVREHFAFLARTIRDNDGAIVKTIGDAVMAAFAEPADAVRAAVAVQAGVAEFNGRQDGEAIAIKMGVHAGHCIAVTLNDRLDYFGQMVNLAARLQGLARSGEVLLSESLADDPKVLEVLADVAPGSAETVAVRGVERPVAVLRLAGPFDRQEVGGRGTGKGTGHERQAAAGAVDR
ncbi:hypothetical protein GCM10017083_29810 [Thalassobaculum fulvum]|uniref:Guanylate cyclase domain-containing protein n=1 Tax=Thalassobaculum fulvum TaxID=1633335 RepID=A0A918XSW1_9PROT|nr:adenylate/guanylate cyclase domain-containing protein [Thalassobaculum fulvum]GHD53300.1 hypothetical protein GCM10017083_29810 [Thalassobaculum fulvum]